MDVYVQTLNGDCQCPNINSKLDRSQSLFYFVPQEISQSSWLDYSKPQGKNYEDMFGLADRPTFRFRQSIIFYECHDHAFIIFFCLISCACRMPLTSHGACSLPQVVLVGACSASRASSPPLVVLVGDHRSL